MGPYTSRKKAIPGAPKLLIAGAFWFASDLHAGCLPLAHLAVRRDKKIPLAHLACAPGITCYPSRICNRCAGDKISENPKKFKKNPKYFKIVKT
jgi:hypothetical protein